MHIRLILTRKFVQVNTRYYWQGHFNCIFLVITCFLVYPDYACINKNEMPRMLSVEKPFCNLSNLDLVSHFEIPFPNVVHFCNFKKSGFC